MAKTDFNKLYKNRRDKVISYMKKNNIGVVLFEDTEGRRDQNIRYLSGHTGDAILLLLADGTSVLSPWDENLAAKMAHIEKIIPFTDFGRKTVTAVKTILSSVKVGNKQSIELSPATSYPAFLQFVDELSEWDVRCREHSVHEFVTNLRAVKDSYEIECTRMAAHITNTITDIIEHKLHEKEILTETDIALLIEKELRTQECERTSFDTLAAGPERSWAIHAFPGYTAGTWGSKGLSILDYGVCYNGYASDVTITIAQGPLTSEQNELLDLVQKAYDECLKMYKPGLSIKAAADKADSLFAKGKKKMPHSLGHGTGLNIHEAPFISFRAKDDEFFTPGNIITLEPGLYDPQAGGCRLENDVLITETGYEVLTNSRIIRL